MSKILQKAALLAGVALLGAGVASGQTAYTWNGTVDSDWANASNWDSVGVPETNGEFNARLNVYGGQALIFTSALGDTTYNPSGSSVPTFGRGLALGNTSSLEIQSGTFTANGSQSTVVAVNAGTSTLTVSGGEFVTGSAGLAVGFTGSGGTGIINIDSGSMTAATITLGGAGSENGYLNLNGGTLAANGFAFGTGSGTTRINLNGGTLQARTNNASFINSNVDELLVGSGGAVIDTNGFNITIVKGMTPDGQSTGGLTKRGAGTLTLSGTNSYDGATAVASGILSLTNGGGLGTGPVAVTAGARIELSGNVTVANTGLATVAGNGGDFLGAIRSVSGDNTWAGSIQMEPAARLGAAAGATLRVSGPITGTDLTLRGTNAETARIELSGSGSSFSTLRIVLATLGLAGGDDRLPTGATVLFDEAGQLDLGGFSQSLVGISSPLSTVRLVGNSSTTSDSVLTITGNSTFGGRLVDAIAGGTRTTGLSVLGSGNFTVTNDANNFTGPVRIATGGVLAIGGTSGQLTGSGEVINDGILRFTQSSTAGVDFLFDKAISGGGSVEILPTSGAIYVFSQPSTYSGGTLIGTAGGNVAAVRLGASSIVDGSTIVSGPLGAGLLAVGNGQVTPSDSITPRTLHNPITVSSQLQLGSSAFLANLTVAGEISGSGGIAAVGNGTVTISGSNSYSGNTAINSGTLVAGHANAFGTTGSVTIGNGAVLGIGNDVVFERPLTIPGTGRVSAGDNASVVLPSVAALAAWESLSPAISGTLADILYGDSLDATARTLASSWTANPGTYLSDILSLSGTGADTTFVLSMSYAGSAAPEDLNIWYRATGSDPFAPLGTSFEGTGPWSAAFTTVGQYGVDTAAGSVWVVTDRNSDFTVIAVPEPAALVLVGLALGAVGLGAASRRRRLAATE